jgi:hypothetical protein
VNKRTTKIKGNPKGEETKKKGSHRKKSKEKGTGNDK